MSKLGRVSSVLPFWFAWTLGCAMAIPDYIHICHRGDPKVAVCIQNSVEALRPLLIKGIPDISVQGIDPFQLDKLAIFDGVENPNVKLYLHNLIVTGLGNFKITKVKMDVDKMIYRVGVKVPFLNLTGNFQVDLKLGQLQMNTNGDVHVEISDVDAQAVMHAHLKENQMIFSSLALRLKVGDFSINVDKFPEKDAIIAQTVKQFISETSKQDLLDLALPHIERKCAEILLTLANQITENFNYDEIFPL